MPKFNDITGQRFGRLIALKPEKKPNGGYRWLCQCDCGKLHSAPHSTALLTGHTQSCGCQRTDPHRVEAYRDNPLDHLKEFLHYDPETGIFTNLKSRGANAKAGTVAGLLDDNGYISIKYFGKTYRAHRLAWFYMTGAWPVEIDHENHDRADNRFCNLRDAGKFGNQQNKGMQHDNTSGFTGVCFHKKTGKWQATITHNKQRIYIGLFTDKNDAITARRKAEIKFGFHPNHGIKLSIVDLADTKDASS